MVSVTQRIKATTQPRGGYVNPRMMDVRYVDGASGPALVDGKEENLHAVLMGLAIDYLARLANGSEPRDVFRVALMGATKLGLDTFAEAIADADSLAPGYIDDATIIKACRLASLDVVYKRGLALYDPATPVTPDAVTIEHIRTMVGRSVAFFREFGPITRDGFTFQGGYTGTVDTGDGDFLTADTLWDFKVSVSSPSSAHTLQLLMYYLLGKRSIHPEFQSVSAIGVFNPRLNAVYHLPIARIPPATIAEVSRDVIGYV